MELRSTYLSKNLRVSSAGESLRGHRALLEAENAAYAPLEITEDMDFEVLSVGRGDRCGSSPVSMCVPGLSVCGLSR